MKNKKGQFGILLGVIIVGFFTLFVFGGAIVNIVNNLEFDRNAGSYCKLSYSASDIHKKVEYYDKCLFALQKMELEGYSVWFFTKPDNYMPEVYDVATSLSDRMHNLLVMDKSSFEYQTGLAQVEDELAYFIGEERDSDGNSRGCDICKFKRAYCFQNHWNMLCWG